MLISPIFLLPKNHYIIKYRKNKLQEAKKTFRKGDKRGNILNESQFKIPHSI